MRISDWSSDVCSSDLLGERGGVKVAIGPHGSATPRAALQKLGCDALVLGEAEEAIVELADSTDWTGVSGLALHRNGNIQVSGKPRSEERRVGKECVSPFKSRWSTVH